MAALQNVVTLYQALKKEWNKKSKNLDKCGNFLTKLKIALTEVDFLPTMGSEPLKQELLVARDVLEIGAQWAVAVKNIPVFERYMAQLKGYYMDYKDELPESPLKYQLLGLNLLCLLSQNRLAEFHTELELLPVEELHSNIYIRHPVSMEQYLMEGSYNKVFLTRGNVPADNYTFFIDILLNTIRDEIAGCIDKAYERIALCEATRMLFFDCPSDMQHYAKQADDKQSADAVVPACLIAKQAIGYARELEMIV